MNQIKNWKVMLERHDELCQVGNATLYDRVKLLVQVHASQDYLADMQAEGKSPVELLNRKVCDTCANFVTLAAVLKRYPNKRQWQTGDLGLMVDTVVQDLLSIQRKQQKKKTSGGGEKRQVKHTATLSEVRDLTQKIEKIETEADHLKKQLEEKERTIVQLSKALESARETIGSLNETISLLKIREGGRSTANIARS